MKRTKRITIGLMIALAVSSGAYAGINDGLVAYYPFEGNTIDYGSWGVDGTINGNVVFQPGIAGQAASFDGSSLIVFPDTAFPVGTGTISLFVKIPNAGQVFSNGGRPIHSPKTNYRSDFGYNFDTGFFGVGDVDTPLITDQWVHYTFVYQDGTSPSEGIGEAYVNGELEGFDTGYINNHNGLPGDGINVGWITYGLIDEVRIYDRALSISEIQQLAMIPEPTTSVLFITGGIVLGGMRCLRGKV
jgi:hypothetical protein